MVFFNNLRKRIERVEGRVQSSFLAAKKDINELQQFSSQANHQLAFLQDSISNVYQWLEYLNHQNSLQDSRFSSLKSSLNLPHDIRGEVRKAVEEFYNLEPLMSRLSSLESQIAEIKLSLSRASETLDVSPYISDIKSRLKRLEERRGDMRERIMKRVSRNSKEYVKSIIYSYIKKYEKIPAISLKEMIVDEQRLCSKSSFYRILDEIEQDEHISVVHTKKEKHYFYMAKTSEQ